MIRSLVTLAMMDAAATLAATVSPFLMASEGHGILGTGNPSVSA